MGVQRVWRALKRFVVYRILRADDTPHRLALGIGIGIFTSWTPLIGGHMLLAVLLAFLMRANKALAATVVWVCNPVTFLPMLLIEWRIGEWIVGPSGGADKGEAQRMLAELAQAVKAPGSLVRDMLTVDFWQHMVVLLAALGIRMWVGAMLMGLVAGGLSYVIARRWVEWYRARRAARKALRARALAALKARRLHRQSQQHPA
jgi:uncharacterized protein (DUF2062 family)